MILSSHFVGFLNLYNGAGASEAVAEAKEGFVTHRTTDHEASARKSAGSGSRRRILVRAVGDEHTASTRYRVLKHLNGLSTAGFDVVVETGSAPRSGWMRLPSRLFELIRDTQSRPDADLLFIQRRTYPPPFARRLAEFELPVVFDFDDALYLPPPFADQGTRSHDRYRGNFEATCRAAEFVISGNSELASQVPHDRVETIPTAIDCRQFSPSAIAAAIGPVIGWVGYSDNLPYLEALADPLRELAHRHHDLRLLVVADRPPQIDGVRVDFRPWSLATEVSCFRDMGIGIMPLEDTPWTRAKCSFKLLQYMALGIPAVASPVGMNREVVEDGRNGCLASTPEEWFICLDRLLGDCDLRQKLAAAGRDTVVGRYSLEAISPRLISLLNGVLDTWTGAGRRERHGPR